MPNAKRKWRIQKLKKINKYKIIDIDRANKNWKSLLYQTNNNLIIEFKNE